MGEEERVVTRLGQAGGQLEPRPVELIEEPDGVGIVLKCT